MILEFKMKNTAEQADLDQCTAYGRDIKEYHFESRRRKVIDALVLTRTKGLSYQEPSVGTHVCSADCLKGFLDSVVIGKTSSCDADLCAESTYEPLPTIVEAAKMFMKNEPLPNIRRVGSTGIPNALNCLTTISKQAGTRQWLECPQYMGTNPMGMYEGTSQH